MKLGYLIIIFLISSFIGNYINARQIEVCKQGCDHDSVQEALDASVDNDSIFIKKGVYKEHDIMVKDKKGLFIHGEEGSVIDIANKGYGFNFDNTSFTLKDMTIKGVKMSYTTDYAAIYTFECFDFNIENIVLENAFFGMLIEKSKNGKIHDNRVSGQGKSEQSTGNAIHLWHSNHMKVTDNKVYEMRDGIYIEFGSNCEFINNESYQNLRYGMHFMFSNDNLYQNNLFYSNSAGVAVMFSKRIKMYENTFEKNWGTASYGLLLKEISDAELKHNTFKNNTIGITADGSTRIDYKQNDFINNGYAVEFIGGCYKNIFKNNNFLYNNFDLSYSGGLNNNKFDENYWSSYTGYDLDKDGHGDVPYRPVKLFSYLVSQTPESIILLRSLFVDIINFSEKVSPVFTPKNLTDDKPLVKEVEW